MLKYQILQYSGMEDEKLKRCPICHCTEHRMIGCGRHWAKHKLRHDGRCELRTT